jgi:hypothetical protein
MSFNLYSGHSSLIIDYVLQCQINDRCFQSSNNQVSKEKACVFFHFDYQVISTKNCFFISPHEHTKKSVINRSYFKYDFKGFQPLKYHGQGRLLSLHMIETSICYPENSFGDATNSEPQLPTSVRTYEIVLSVLL